MIVRSAILGISAQEQERSIAMAQQQEDKPVKLDKKTLAEKMKEIDFCMMTTLHSTGELNSRPMSNNKNVEWDGDTWFFAYKDSSQVKETQSHSNVNLSYAVPKEVLFISLRGRGEIVADVAKKKELWYDDLERWFPDGPEDESVVLIKVVGEYIEYWGKDGDGSLGL